MIPLNFLGMELNGFQYMFIKINDKLIEFNLDYVNQDSLLVGQFLISEVLGHQKHSRKICPNEFNISCFHSSCIQMGGHFTYVPWFYFTHVQLQLNDNKDVYIVSIYHVYIWMHFYIQKRFQLINKTLPLYYSNTATRRHRLPTKTY